MVNFCVAILILKMQENTHFQYIMIYYFRKGKYAAEMQEKICAVYGEGAVMDGTYQKWFVMLHARDFSLDNDASQSGRPVEVDNNQIETVTENNQHYAMQEIAGILKLSKSMLMLFVKIKNVSFILQRKLYGLFGEVNILNDNRWLIFN